MENKRLQYLVNTAEQLVSCRDSLAKIELDNSFSEETKEKLFKVNAILYEIEQEVKKRANRESQTNK